MATDSDSIKAEIRALGRRVDWHTIGRTYLMYLPLLTDESRRGVRVYKDLAYGGQPRHVLDIYTRQAAAPLPPPILVFVHGGGFVQGDKSRESNVGYYFARHGFVALSINYRLAPRFQWPCGAEDLAEAVQWVRTHAAIHGGDIGRMFLMGHSAGAAHVATYLFGEGFRACDDESIKGAILLSGPTYDTEKLNPQKDYVYFGDNIQRHPAMSVIRRLGMLSPENIPPLFIGYAELDPPEIEYQALTLFKALNSHGTDCASLIRLLDHNHISEIMHINTGDEALGLEILAFCKAATPDSPWQP